MGPKSKGSEKATGNSEFFVTHREKPSKEISPPSLHKNHEMEAVIPAINLEQVAIDPQTVNLIPGELARKYKILPLKKSGNRLQLAMVDPANLEAIDYLESYTGLYIDSVTVGEAELEWAVAHYPLLETNSSLNLAVRDLQRDMEPAAPDFAEYEARDLSGDPVVKLVDTLLIHAVRTGASDIHVEPQDHDLRIRLRIDGDLSEIAFVPRQAASAILSRLKILCGLDITEKRLPQDGRLTTTIDDRQISFRASTIPSIHGEKLVLRVLDQKRSLLSVDNLGLDGPNRRSFDRLLQHPHGLILVTGPTGSGKTSTLYAMLEHLNSPSKNILTLEDPVEYCLSGVVQVPVNARVGLGFAAGLRSVLRVDPNIIMVGEIRDAETASLTVQAALTGHLVMSTLHTTSAAGTVTRLIDMGIDSFSLASTLIGVISQRLVRLVCPACREAYILQGAAAQKFGLTGEPSQFFYRNTGCHLCRLTGYRGRLAIQEVLEVGGEIKNLIAQGAIEQDIEDAARSLGMTTLKDDGFNKARRGLTTIEEVLRTVCLGP